MSEKAASLVGSLLPRWFEFLDKWHPAWKPDADLVSSVR
jgi:hypothetical protein